MICAARYAKDNKWYRAQVSKLPGKRKVEVQFVDYGNTETVDCSDISRIPDDYIKYPMQVWCVYVWVCMCMSIFHIWDNRESVFLSSLQVDRRSAL